MSRFTYILVLCAIVALAYASEKKAEKTPEEKQVKHVVKQIMTSPDGTPKSKKEVKKIVKKLEKEREKARHGIFHHVYRSTQEAEDIDTEERNAAQVLKMKDSYASLFKVKHLLNEKDSEEGELKPLDPETQELQKKYEKLLKTVLKENENNSKKQSTMELIKEVDKRMRKQQKTHPIKTSDRMIAFMKELLRQLNGGTLQGANKYNIRALSALFSVDIVLVMKPKKKEREEFLLSRNTWLVKNPTCVIILTSMMNSMFLMKMAMTPSSISVLLLIVIMPMKNLFCRLLFCLSLNPCL